MASSISFQIVSWEAFDTINDEEKAEYFIYLFGRTLDKKSVCCKLENYTPFFYIKIPDDLQSKWIDYHTNELKNFLKKKLYSQKEELKSISLINKKTIKGFTNNKKFKFLKLVFYSIRAFNKCKYIFSSNSKYEIKISSEILKFDLYESNIEPYIRFSHIVDIKMAGHVKILEYYENEDSRCDISISTKWNKVKNIDNDSINPIKILSYDIECVPEDKKQFPDPQKDNDIITQIGCTFQNYSEESYQKIMLSLNSPIDNYIENVPDIKILSFDSEKELLIAFIDLIKDEDPDIITGYNINTFDWKFIHFRCLYNDIDYSDLSRLNEFPAKYIKQFLNTSAYGENNFEFINCIGVYNSDLFTIIKREHKLESYKLGNIGKIFIGDTKDDLTPQQLFIKAFGSAKDIATVIKYCTQDTVLVLNIILKLCIIPNIISMANVTKVPIKFIEYNGQQVKVHSQLTYKARKRDFLVPVPKYKSQEEADLEEKFTGATVLDAEPDAHFEQISGLDFASLYPSIMIANNFSYETLVDSEEYDNLDNIIYKDIIWTENQYTSEEKTIKNRFVQPNNDKDLGILPEILDELWKERKAIKKKMNNEKKLSESESDPIKKKYHKNMYEIYNGAQLAMKVSMNSIYGFTGAKFGRLPEKKIAGSVTAEGRSMIQKCKKFVEKNYDCKVVYGDTDSIYVKFKTGLDVNSQEHMDKVFELSEEAAKGCSNLFKLPIELEFEKVMWPFILFSKKRYACVIWTNQYKYDYIDYKGIQVVRRENCDYVKNNCMKIFEKILLNRDINGAKELSRKIIKNLLDGNVPIKELYLSKSLKGEGSYEFDKTIKCENSSCKFKYKIKEFSLNNINKELIKKCPECNSNLIRQTPNIPHVALARKMEERDKFNCPAVGERVPFVFIKTNIKNARQFEKVEDPNFAIKNLKEIDYNYYFEHQLKSAIDTIFGPILKDNINEIYSGLIEEKQKRTRKKKEIIN